VSRTLLYADHRYSWMLMSQPHEARVLVRAGDYRLLGDPIECVQQVYDWLKETFPYVNPRPNGIQGGPIQVFMADGMGVSQRAVSNWVTGLSSPNVEALSPDGFRWLVQAARCAESWRLSQSETCQLCDRPCPQLFLRTHLDCGRELLVCENCADTAGVGYVEPIESE